MVHYRITPEGQFLKVEDYKLLANDTRYGFGLNTSHYMKVCKAREEYNKKISAPQINWSSGVTTITFHNGEKLPVRDDFQENYDTREGHAIDGTPFHTRPHPYHNLRLLEKETGKIYLVDSVHKQHYFGYFILLLVRAEGTNSHGSVYWENISCKDPIIVEGVQEAHERFEVLKAQSA
jgi:hypothetical protein